MNRQLRSFIRRLLCQSLIFLQIGIACMSFFGCEGSVPDDLLLASKPSGLIFVKATRSSSLNRFSRGGNLYSLIPASPDGKLTNLTNLESGDVADPEISYDGLKILFSMRKSSSERWHIYEMNVDGSNLTQLTFSQADDFDPTYMPNGKILFTSNRPGFRDEYNIALVEVLHSMNRDGSDVEQISFNLSDDFDPIITSSGAVAYTRWEHHGTMNRFPVFTTNPDGCATFVLFGPHNRNFFHVRELPTGDMVATMSRRVNGDAGALAILKTDNGHADPPQENDYQNLAPDIVSDDDLRGPPFPKGAFKFPHPLPDGRLIVSFSGRYGTFTDDNDEIIEETEPDFGLYTINTDGSELTLLYNDSKTQELDAVVISPRPMPGVILSVIDHSVTTGEFIDQSVYFRQSNDGQEVPAPGEIKNIMIIEGIPITSGDRDMISLTSFERKRILGVAPVYPDGSTIFKVPVNTPISVNTLDSLGRSVVTKRTWFYIRPGEPRGVCIGCHSPRGERRPSNPMAENMQPFDVAVPVAQREIVAFQNAIAPIIEQKCVTCHTGTNPGGNLELSLAATGTEGSDRYPQAYRNLLSSSRDPRLVVAPFSRRSYLADKLLGVGRLQGAGHHPNDDNALTDDEIRKFINWIDLGGQYR